MAAAAKAVGVPIKLLHEGEGHMVRPPPRGAPRRRPRDDGDPAAMLHTRAGDY